ncbi:hypothetical protein ACFL6P_01385 [Candidatus Latescibacterota bacterium]
MTVRRKRKETKKPNKINRKTLDEWVGILLLKYNNLLSKIPDAYIEAYLTEEYRRKRIFTKEDVANVTIDDVMAIIASKDILDGKINSNQEKSNDTHKLLSRKELRFIDVLVKKLSYKNEKENNSEPEKDELTAEKLFHKIKNKG